MEASISKCKISRFFLAHSITRIKYSSLVPKSARIQRNLENYQSTKLRRNRQFGHRAVVNCAKSDGCLVTELDAEFMNSGESWVFDKDGNCQERKGIVELMECLETEAIMGEDEGKEANDYNRRTEIFEHLCFSLRYK